MEENREQPIIMPATALNRAEDECAMSEVGSQEGDLGKFKNVQALMDAYNSLQAEFTKKCQLLSQLQKDKTESSSEQTMPEQNSENNENELKLFLQSNEEAKKFEEEIKEKFSSNSSSSPYRVAWAEVVLNHLKDSDKANDPFIEQYVLSDENVKNKIIEEYIKQLSTSKPPLTISSHSGQRLSGTLPDSPQTLADAKKIVDKMFG